MKLVNYILAVCGEDGTEQKKKAVSSGIRYSINKFARFTLPFLHFLGIFVFKNTEICL